MRLYKGMINFELLDRPIGLSPMPSIEEAPKFNLNPLPSPFHYAYLGAYETLHVVVSSELSDLHEEKLLRVIREHTYAIRWTVSDIHGISPYFLYA